MLTCADEMAEAGDFSPFQWYDGFQVDVVKATSYLDCYKQCTDFGTMIWLYLSMTAWLLLDVVLIDFGTFLASMAALGHRPKLVSLCSQ